MQVDRDRTKGMKNIVRPPKHSRFDRLKTFQKRKTKVTRFRNRPVYVFAFCARIIIFVLLDHYDFSCVNIDYYYNVTRWSEDFGTFDGGPNGIHYCCCYDKIVIYNNNIAFVINIIVFVTRPTVEIKFDDNNNVMRNIIYPTE